MSVGERIKYYRNQEKLTQEALAKKSKMSRSYIADVERDRYNPSLDTLKRIARALGISVIQLMENENDNIVYGEESDYKTLNRAMKNMTPEQRKKAIKILGATFEELFDDED